MYQHLAQITTIFNLTHVGRSREDCSSEGKGHKKSLARILSDKGFDSVL